MARCAAAAVPELRGFRLKLEKCEITERKEEKESSLKEKINVYRFDSYK